MIWHIDIFAQLRCGGIQGSGTIGDRMSFGTDQGWQEAVIAYVQQYSRRTNQYYKRFLKDFKAGKYGKN